MTKEDLETKARKAVLEIKEKVNRIYDILKDVGMKLTHVIEYKLDYHTLPKGLDYEDS
ncbi:MAG: hypothetical protein Q8O13_08615 [Candidatus Omnitrophota bacterium]|nr:hypothetical protein [Candidatus Omnitrophota bacterium]